MKSPIIKGVIVLFVIFGLCSYIVSAKNEKKILFSQLQEMIGTQTIQTLKEPIRVFVSKVDSIQKELNPDEINVLQGYLLNDKSFIFNRNKKCLFIPEISFQFDHTENVIILCSTICNQIKIMTPNSTILLDYDPIAPEFNRFCQGILTSIKESIHE